MLKTIAISHFSGLHNIPRTQIPNALIYPMFLPIINSRLVGQRTSAVDIELATAAKV